MSSSDMATGAREAIRIAEKIFPEDTRRQRDLAREIVGAINLCESEFAQEIISRMKNQSTDVVSAAGESK